MIKTNNLTIKLGTPLLVGLLEGTDEGAAVVVGCTEGSTEGMSL